MNRIRQMTHREALNIVLEYQKTGDEKLFAILLAKYDELLLKTLYRYQAMNKYMYRDPLQEIYHIAILGLSNCIKTIPASEKPCMLPGRIRRYVECAFRAAYKAQNFDYEICASGHSLYKKSISHDEAYKETENRMDIATIFKRVKLTALEKNLVKLRYLKEMSLNEIHLEYHMPVATVRKYIKIAMNKIRKEMCE